MKVKKSAGELFAEVALEISKTKAKNKVLRQNQPKEEKTEIKEKVIRGFVRKKSD